jgi:tetratricopeptide (TPR) repeat protein
MNYLRTMHKAATIKKAMFALAFVLFVGQGFAQTAVYSEARRDITNEKFKKAVSDLQTHLAAEPKDEKAEYLLGLAYMGLEDYSKAKGAFRSGAGHGSRYPMNHVGLAATAVKDKDLKGAEDHVTKAMEVDRKGEVETLLGIAKAYLGYPDLGPKHKAAMMPFLKEGELYLYKVQKVEPNNAESFVLLGKLYDLQGVYELAESNYEQAIVRDPNYIFGYFRLGQLYKGQEKYNEAADKFQKCIEIDPKFSPAYREMAEMWYLAGKYKKADEYMQKYLELMDNDLSARLRSGTFKYLGGQYDEAITILEGVAPDTVSLALYRILGYAYVKKDTPNPDKALEWLNKYFSEAKPISHIPSDFENKGKAYQLKGEMDKAIAEYEKAIALGEKQETPNYNIWLDLAEYYKEQKDYAKQAEYLARFLVKQTDYQLKESFDLGLALYRIEDYSKADSVFKIMTEEKPDITIGWSWRAKSNAQLDKDSKEGLAKPYYEKVLEVVGDDAEMIAKFEKDYVTANKYLASYYTLVAEDYSAAIPYWEKILELDPTDEGAKNGLAYCEERV